MNNSKIIIEGSTLDQEEIFDRRPYLRKRITELTDILGALQGIENNEHWVTLQELVFKGVLEKLEKELLTEAQKKKINQRKLYKLQGQIEWAKIYADTDRFTNRIKSELSAVRKELKHQEDANK